MAELEQLTGRSVALFQSVLAEHRAELTFQEVGEVRSLQAGTAVVRGLAGMQASELVTFASRSRGPGGHHSRAWSSTSTPTR